MTLGDAREGKWRWNWRRQWVASILHTTSEHAVSSITTVDAHISAASSRLNWRPHRFNPLNAELNPICHLLALLGGANIVVVSRLRVKWTRPFQGKTKCGFCACAITFRTSYTTAFLHCWCSTISRKAAIPCRTGTLFVSFCAADGIYCTSLVNIFMHYQHN